MKQFNRIILGVCVAWLLLTAITMFWIQHNTNQNQDKGYLVEINRICDLFTHQKAFSEVDLSGYQYIEQVDYLPVEQDGLAIFDQSGSTTTPLTDFFHGKSIPAYHIPEIPKSNSYQLEPWYNNSALQGYLRFSYASDHYIDTVRLMIMNGILLGMAFLFTIVLLLYIRNSILRPFNEISSLPYELSKGHLPVGIKEIKYRYFGKFLWGLDLLRKRLEENRQKELQMEKDKKLMILSISHDIKTPLSTIKLYSKALYERLYDTEEKKQETAKRIEEKADQIEHFVSEIIKTSSTELFEFDIRMGEFYLSSLMESVKRAYLEKLELLKIDFIIQPYKDKLLSGDMDKLIDVFDNIIQNAIKYGDGKKIGISFDEEDNCQLIRVTSTGTPISSYHLHHMFESFWRGENAIGKQGNGLGLYICKQLMRRMDGEIFAETGMDEMSFILVIKKG